LLNYSKTAGREDLELTDIDVNGLITEVVTLLNNEAKKKEIEFDLKLDPSLSLGKMDKEKFRQVLLNLVLNAIHATDRGKITLSTAVRQDELRRVYLEITVADTGVGISEENLHNLFNPFFTTKKAEGTGLGLMTCHHIIEEHRGNIDVRSELGKGTTVVLQIPVDPLKHERRKSDRRIDV
jgi:signal transduction histidine kinase